MKKSTGKLLIGLAVGILLAGAVGTIAYGSDGFTNFDVSTWFDGEWRQVEILDQEKAYTGEKIEPDITLPKGFIYEIVKIEKEGEELDLESGAIEIGDYVFTIKVTKEDESRDYFCNLKIVEPSNQVETNVDAKNLNLKLLSVMLADDGSVIKEFTYEINPSNASNQSINVSVAWAGEESSSSDDDSFKSGKTVTDYVTIAKDESQKKITLTCKQAFGSQVLANVVSIDNPEAKASVKVEYRKKRTHSYEISGNTISSSVISVDDLINFTYQDSVGTLPFNGEAEDVFSLEDGTINSAVSSVFTGHTNLINALIQGSDFSTILSEVNSLEADAYNDVVEAMNSYSTDLITRSWTFSNADTNSLSGTITYGVDLGTTTVKVEGIIIGDTSIEF